MNPWHGEIDLEDLNGRGAQSLNSNLGIEITKVTDTALHGRMPVDGRTVQPAGVLHGGASVAFAETLASWAGYLAVDRTRFHVVGQEIKPITSALHPRAGSMAQRALSTSAGAPMSGKCGSPRCTLAVLEVPSSYAVPEERQ